MNNKLKELEDRIWSLEYDFDTLKNIGKGIVIILFVIVILFLGYSFGKIS